MSPAETLPVWCVLSCVSCREPVAGCWTRAARVPRRTLRDLARREGAVFRERDGEPVCEGCASDPTNGR